MAPRRAAQWLLVLVVTLTLGVREQSSASAERSLDREWCTSAVEEWSESQLGEAQELKWQLQEQQEQEGHGVREMPELLFFLHIPRAGGKSYWQCFLSALMPAHLQCNMSYHKLRDDPSHACRLLATHDDYSMTQRLPPGTRTFVTSLFREPVDRVISSYEFAAHIAARSMGLETDNYPDDTVMSARKKVRDHYANMVSTDTRNIWPWTVLSVAMEEDLWSRRDFTSLPPEPPGFDLRRADMYDMPHLMIPLREFVEMPLTRDTVHNNAVFQLAGITNNSIHADATRLRQCVIKFPELGEHVLELAKARVDTLAHLGFTDSIEEGMSLLAAMIGRSLNARPYDMPQAGWKPRCHEMRRHVDPQHPTPTLRESFKACMGQQTELTILNDRVAFQNFGPLELGRQARKKISKDVIKRIKQLNALDMELTEYARKVYQRKLDEYMGEMEDFQYPDPDRDCV